jgi:hypothetical protein
MSEEMASIHRKLKSPGIVETGRKQARSEQTIQCDGFVKEEEAGMLCLPSVPDIFKR